MTRAWTQRMEVSISLHLRSPQPSPPAFNLLPLRSLSQVISFLHKEQCSQQPFYQHVWKIPFQKTEPSSSPWTPYPLPTPTHPGSVSCLLSFVTLCSHTDSQLRNTACPPDPHATTCVARCLHTPASTRTPTSSLGNPALAKCFYFMSSPTR